MAEAHKEKCQARMLEICERVFPEELKRLQTIPGIKERAATSLIAEIGTDMNKFEKHPEQRDEHDIPPVSRLLSL